MKYLKNAFQTPNETVDVFLPKLSAKAIKCYLVIIRKTIGWNKEFDSISASQFSDLTGIRKSDVIWSAIRELKDFRLIEDEAVPGKPTKFKVVLQTHHKNEGTPKNGVPNQDGVTPGPKKGNTLKRGTQNPSSSKPKKPIISSSSSSLPPQNVCEDDDEVCNEIVVSSFFVPPELSHLAIATIEEIAKKMSEKPHINNPVRYKEAILEKIKNGDKETIENILIIASSKTRQPLDRSDKRKLGELRSEVKTRIGLMKDYGEPLDLILKDVQQLILPHIHSFPREDLEKIVREELFMAGFEGVV